MVKFSYFLGSVFHLFIITSAYSHNKKDSFPGTIVKYFLMGILINSIDGIKTLNRGEVARHVSPTKTADECEAVPPAKV